MTSRADRLVEFAHKHCSTQCDLIPLAGDASFRRYIRVVTLKCNYMLMDAPPEKETITPFMTICSWLHAAGFSTPTIIAHDTEQGFVLMEDLGDDTFSRLLAVDDLHQEEYYTAAIDLLVDWHTRGLPQETLDIPLYDQTVLIREVKLFSDWFLPQVLDGSALHDAQASYVECWKQLLSRTPLGQDQFVHRDFHADNLMWLPTREGDARVGLLDFQDALWGDAAYDMVSLLEDARRDVPADLVMAMKTRYVQRSGADAMAFDAAYALLAAQRNCKILGIFTRLAARDGKHHYLQLLPRVWGHVKSDIKHPLLAPLAAWFARHVPVQYQGEIAIRKDANALGLVA